MKRFILIAGIGFYVLTFITIFAITYFQFSVSRPSMAKVINVNTKEKVWQESIEALDVYPETRLAAIANPSHSTDAVGTQKEGTKTDWDIQVAYGAYYERLFADGQAEASAPKVSDGDQAYTEAVCWHCHSQFVRPLAYEQYRWGPVSQIAESAHDNPSRFGTRRIGPDLTREGNRRPNDWHYAHFFNPRYTVPQSIMARYGGVDRYWYQVDQARRDELQFIAEDAASALVSEDAIAGRANAAELSIEGFDLATSLMDEFSDQGDEVWVLHKGTDGNVYENSVGSRPVLRVVPKPQKRIRELTEYVQTRGLTIGKTGRTNNFIGSPEDVETLKHEDNATWQAYVRKLEFVSGRWRTQSAVGRPASRPEHVLAPAEMIQASPAEGASEREVLAYEGLKEKWDLSLNRGKNLYIAKCAGCHGGQDVETGLEMEFDLANRNSEAFRMVGNGYGPAAQWLAPEPRNFHISQRGQNKVVKDEDGNFETTDERLTPRQRGTNVGLYKNRSGDPASLLARPEDLYQTLRNGMPPSAMPAWPFLRDWEVWDLVNFIMYLGDDYAAYEKGKLQGLTDEQMEMVGTRKGYWSIKEVTKAFSVTVELPDLPRKPSNDNVFKNTASDQLFGLHGKQLEDYAAGFWKSKLGDAISLDGEAWSDEELVAIGRAIYLGNAPDGSAITLAKGGAIPECVTCHGTHGDSWSSRRGELLSAHGYAARNYYTGQYKLGASREGIFRAMYYGVANSLMNAQIKVANRVSPGGAYAALEAHALAEFVLDKSRQGVYGIKPESGK